MHKITKRQKPIKGGRKQLPSCVLPSMWKMIDNIAKQYKVSRSWVIATILSEQLKVPNQEKYYE